MPARKLPPLAQPTNRHDLIAPSGPGPRLRDAWLIPMAQLVPNSWQPRRRANPVRLQELAKDIAERGVLEPLIVRPLEDGHYQIIAGERRYHAAGLAGLESVPCLVRDVDEAEARAIALVENLQREDLDVEDEARFLKELHDNGMSLREIGAAIHKSYQYVNRRIKLASDPDALHAYREGRLNLDSLITDRGRSSADVPMADLVAAAQAAADDLLQEGDVVTQRNSDDELVVVTAARDDGEPARRTGKAPSAPRPAKTLQKALIEVRRVQSAALPIREREAFLEAATVLRDELAAAIRALNNEERQEVAPQP